jgi:predicted amidophosphoribosyltransferase
VIGQAIHQLKSKNPRAVTESLTELPSNYLQAYSIPAEVPVSLHRRRLRERGYKQSELLTRKLGTLTGQPVEAGYLVRNRHIYAQTPAKSIAERRHNVAGAFILKSGGAASVRDLTIAREV